MKSNGRKLAYITGIGFLLFFAWRFLHTSGRAAPAPKEFIMGVQVHTGLLPAGSAGRPGGTRQVGLIVIHETANTAQSATAAAHAEYLLAGTGTTAWHYTVDETEIYRHIPDEEPAYHAGDTDNPYGGNAVGIGVELCINYGCDFDKVMDNAARLSAHLLYTYGLGMEALVQHYDCSGKNCPAHMRGTGLYEVFFENVQTYLTALQTGAYKGGGQ